MKRVLAVCLMLITVVSCSVALHGETATVNPEDLVEQVPLGAYRMDRKVVFADLPYTDLLKNYSNILIRTLHDRGYLKNLKASYSEDPATDAKLERVPVDTVKSVFDSLFGVGSYDRLDGAMFIGIGGVLQCFDGSKEYVYYEFPGGGDPGCNIREAVVSSEVKGETVSVRVRFGMFRIDYGYPCTVVGDTSFYSGVNPYQKAILAYVDDAQSESFQTGGFDNYLPLYEHTFRENGDGTYHWVSTEMVEQPQPISESLGLRPSQVAGSDSYEPADPVTDLPSIGGVSDALPDRVTVVEPSETDDEFPILWFLSGIGIVAVGIPFVIVLARKKKTR